MLAQAEVGRTRRRRKPAVQTTNHDGGSGGAASKVVVMDNGRTSASHSRVDCTVNGTNPVGVKYWVPDGSCYEGKTRHVGGQVVFIESKRVVPVGTEVTIRLTLPDDISADWGVAEGIVVWICPTDDEFRNRQGFGISLRGCRPLESGTVEKEVLKGSA